MARYVMDFQEIDRSSVAAVGGKAAQLAELSRIEGVSVPAGFCVTTAAYDRVAVEMPELEGLLGSLAVLRPDDRDAIGALSARVRALFEGAGIPTDLAAAVTDAAERFGNDTAFAVRSSATAEDLPTASFAGQQDTYLNVVGASAVLERLRCCWASLFTERAVIYRLRNGFDQRHVRMAVVVQEMVFPDASGILFTADPVTGNRRVTSIEASFGLGEALVSGLVNPDVYKVRDSEVTERTIAAKRIAVCPEPDGGTSEQPIDPARQGQPALAAAQVLQLADLGRCIEAQFGRPQDIEWCLVDDDFRFVQSRPITTLFPIPEVDDAENHVFVSVGHGQMMTDAMKPLGLSVWQLTTLQPMMEAGGRLFVDFTQRLARPTTRAMFLDMMGKSDPLMRDAMETVLGREGFIPSLPDDAPAGPPSGMPPRTPIETDPAIVTELISENEASVATLRRDIATKTGTELLEFILADFQELRRLLFDARSHEVFMSAMDASSWLNEHLEEWLAEKNAADVLTHSVPNNITSEMGLALLDVADAVRPHPEVVEYLQDVDDDGFLGRMGELEGGPEARDAIRGFLDRYGMRCVGEIDITRPRWSEEPTALLPVILGNVRNFEAGAAARLFEEGRLEALAKERELLERLRALPDGEAKADETKRMIDRVRTFIGYREYPKFGMVSRYFIYKQALVGEAERLVQAGVLSQPHDIFFLRLQELADVVRTQTADHELIRERVEAFRVYESLTPPRVLTSEGEAITGAYRRDDMPAGALVGLPVSAGTVEGRARIILDIAQADLEAGDILVTAYTDPSWTPLFVAIGGLVTEVGGLMTHGAVIAREYGLPAVVGVHDATRLIADGQRIRVNGTDGYVEILH